MKIVDLAKALCEKCELKEIGIRAGEKLHEVMITSDDRVVEFKEHYVIKPTIQFAGINDFTKNNLGEIGKELNIGFEYNSGNNSEWLTKEEFLKLVKEFL
jgi:UDP-N-acetylglucosamine 4,6-dehydratase